LLFEVVPPVSGVEEILFKAGEGRILSVDEYVQVYDFFTRHRPNLDKSTITYSRKVFIPLTNLCRDSCGYCVFAKKPWDTRAKTYTLDEVISIARIGEKLGCKEALFSLGDKPELAYPEFSEYLSRLGFRSTVEYLIHACDKVNTLTSLIPHVNPGTLSWSQMKEMKNVCASMGVMLENVSERLMEKGMAHENCPDKHPKARIAMIKAAGSLKIPFTTGILVGIGETVRERVESLLALRTIQLEFGHIQEVIIQNFRPKMDTRMSNFPEPQAEDFLATISLAHLILGGLTTIQAPPNLARVPLIEYVERGVRDFGGISPLTVDYINPEAPWPHLRSLKGELERMGYSFRERLCVYPRYIKEAGWVSRVFDEKIKEYVGGDGLVRPPWEAF
jgi:7,8-didemethyl-8-hydroxy-5-deazariboflavin synthase CofG subunit